MSNYSFERKVALYTRIREPLFTFKLHSLYFCSTDDIFSFYHCGKTVYYGRYTFYHWGKTVYY